MLISRPMGPSPDSRALSDALAGEVKCSIVFPAFRLIGTKSAAAGADYLRHSWRRLCHSEGTRPAGPGTG
jgi:hypothetical protein